MGNKKRVLVTGASGSVGIETLKHLVERKESFYITAFDIKSKSTQKKLSKFERDIHIVFGDISNINDLDWVCRNQDVVIHLAAIIPPLADRNPVLAYNVNTLGTQNLVIKLHEHSPYAFLIYSSSISVYGDRVESPWITIDDPLIPSEGDEYAVTKILAEEIIKSSNLDWSIFRLTGIMGGHKISNLIFHAPLETSLEITTTSDAGRAFVKAIDKQKIISGRMFNLGGGEKCRTTYREFMKRIFAYFGLDNIIFPQYSFATKNFHSGFYKDSYVLEEILHFRKETLEDFYSGEKEKSNVIFRFIASVFHKPILNYMLKRSDPYQAVKHNNKDLIRRYFGSINIQTP